MSQPAQHRPIGIEEYLTDEQGAQIRHEFIGGRVYAMVGASDRHNLVAGNVFVALHQHLRVNDWVSSRVNDWVSSRVVALCPLLFPPPRLSDGPRNSPYYNPRTDRASGSRYALKSKQSRHFDGVDICCNINRSYCTRLIN